MTSNDPIILYQNPARAQGVVRELRGITARGERFVEVGSIVQGEPRRGSWISAASAPMVLEGIEAARARDQRTIGRFRDGRFDVEISSGRRNDGSFALHFQRFTEGQPAGSTIVIFHDELDHLDEAIAWIFREATS